MLCSLGRLNGLLGIEVKIGMTHSQSSAIEVRKSCFCQRMRVFQVSVKSPLSKSSMLETLFKWSNQNGKHSQLSLAFTVTAVMES